MDAYADAHACCSQLMAMLLYVGAWLCALAATLMPQWRTLHLRLGLGLGLIYVQLGLWKYCKEGMGGMGVMLGGDKKCWANDSTQDLPSDIKLARALIPASLAVGLLGALLAVAGIVLLNCSRGPWNHRAKRGLIMAGGACGVLSGVLCLVPVCNMLHKIMAQFPTSLPKIPGLPEMEVPRWSIGGAVFCGLTGGFLLVVTGLILVSFGLSSPTPRHHQPPGLTHQGLQPNYPPAPPVRNSGNSTKTHSEDV